MLRFNLKKIVLWPVIALLAAVVVNPSLSEELTPAETRPLRTIVIDPGHGGHDNGAVGPGGTAEKDVTLTLAMMTAKALGPLYQVVLTRTGDYQVEPADRVAMANSSQADLFISLHVGGGFSMQCDGVTVFFLNAEFDQVQNALDAAAQASPDTRAFVRWDEAHFSHYRFSRAFANILEQTCREVLQMDCRVKNDQVAVLEGVNHPAVMLEIGCLANPVWEDRFRNKDRLQVTAEMIAGAIGRFFQFDPAIEESDID